MVEKIYAKLILLGNSTVGKTSIVNRYYHHKFDGNVTMTVGHFFMTKKI